MTLKVLTVDDSKTIRMIVKKAFKPYDIEIHEAENGVEGLAVANNLKPDLIVLDITMPIMDGIEMLGKLKGEDRLKDIPVIMLTAESGKENVLKIVKMGVKDYIVKPFKGEQLIERVVKIYKLEAKKEDEVVSDTSQKYFYKDGDVQIMDIDGKVNRAVMAEVESHLQKKIKEMNDSGMGKFIMNLSKVSETNVTLIKLIIFTIQSCHKSSISVRVVGSANLNNELKEFQETSELKLDASVEAAKALFK